MVTEPKISIAELEAAHERYSSSRDMRAAAYCIDTVPALIAIVKAAQAVIDAHDDTTARGDAWHMACADARSRLRAQLGKVRP